MTTKTTKTTNYKWTKKKGSGIEHLKERIDKGLWPAVQELRKDLDQLQTLFLSWIEKAQK